MKLKRDNVYFHWGITALAVLLAGVVFALILANLGSVLDVLGRILTVFSPIIYGMVFAYILNPLMVFAENALRPGFEKNKKLKPGAAKKWCRLLGIIFALLVAVLVVYGFLALLLPNLIKSLTAIASNTSDYYVTMQNWISDLAIRNPEYADIINTAYDTVFTGISGWLTNFLQNDLSTFATNVASSLYMVVKSVLNLIIGLVAAVYLLASKEQFLALTKKMIVALMKRSRADRFFEISNHANTVFSGFISGKLLDSLIIAVLCYIGMLILGIPYPELISTIVGVTNVIPFFGPVIGAVPSAIIIVLINPLKALYFLIFILLLQQLDGNVIGPRILGDAVGLPSFWILFAITIFGGFFGFIGMLVGVPVFAVIYMLVKEAIEARLQKKGAPVSTECYLVMKSTDDLEQKAEAPVYDSEEEISEEELAEAEKDFWK